MVLETDVILGEGNILGLMKRYICLPCVCDQATFSSVEVT
jgi:hypothetical protein